MYYLANTNVSIPDASGKKTKLQEKYVVRLIPILIVATEYSMKELVMCTSPNAIKSLYHYLDPLTFPFDICRNILFSLMGTTC